VHHGGVHPVPADSGHLDRQEAVVEEDPGARADVASQILVGGGNLARLGGALRSEDDPAAGGQLQGRAKGANPDPGAVLL